MRSAYEDLSIESDRCNFAKQIWIGLLLFKYRLTQVLVNGFLCFLFDVFGLLRDTHFSVQRDTPVQIRST